MKVLITTLGSYGDLNPLLGIAIELREQGHTVGIATSLYFKEVIKTHGFTFYEIFPNLDPRFEDLKKYVTDPVKGPELLHKKYIFPGLEKSYDVFSEILDEYDIVLSSTLTYFAPIACRVKNKPWLSVCLSPMLFFSAFEPPVLAVLPKLKHLYFSPAFNKILFNLLFRVSSSWLKPYHQLYKKAGLSGKINPFLKEGFSPYGTLALFSSDFGKRQPDWPNNVCTAGFSFYDRSNGLQEKNDLQEFLSLNPNTILFTLGTTAVMNPGKMFDVFIEVQQQSGFSCIILTGKENYEKYKKHQSKNVFIADIISYSAVMPHCSLIIHQGGIGTTAQAMRSRNPMIIIPHCNDQYDNAQRAEKLGISKTIPYRNLNPKRLLKIINEVMHSDNKRNNAIELSKNIQKINAEQNAVRFIQQVLDESLSKQ